MPPKPHRVLLERVSGYADEAAAFLRRRRHIRKPFARVHHPGGRSLSYLRESEEGRALFEAAGRLIEIAGPSRRPRRPQLQATTSPPRK
jgi:hypothetical protein